MKYEISTPNERVWSTTQLAKLSLNHSIGRTHSCRLSIFYVIRITTCVRCKTYDCFFFDDTCVLCTLYCCSTSGIRYGWVWYSVTEPGIIPGVYVVFLLNLYGPVRCIWERISSFLACSRIRSLHCANHTDRDNNLYRTSSPRGWSAGTEWYTRYSTGFCGFQVLDPTVAWILSSVGPTIRRGRGYPYLNCTTVVTHIPGLLVAVGSDIVPWQVIAAESDARLVSRTRALLYPPHTSTVSILCCPVIMPAPCAPGLKYIVLCSDAICVIGITVSTWWSVGHARCVHTCTLCLSQATELY